MGLSLDLARTGIEGSLECLPKVKVRRSESKKLCSVGVKHQD